MCFGLSDDLDRKSLVCFLHMAGREEFAATLAGRLSPEEIHEYVDNFMSLLRRHLNENEYHSLFLQDSSHQHNNHRLEE